MAANRFATMVHRNTNRISLILVYAFLEWVLIFLLLLNSLFSYLIIKFAEYFGLKPPCLFCTRLDHVFDPAKRDAGLRRDLLCEAHCKEISRFSYCLNHGKLVESREICRDCAESKDLSRNPRFFPRITDSGKIQGEEEKVGENGEMCLQCVCCGVSLNDNDMNNTYPSYLLLKTSSWDVLECHPQKNLAIDDSCLLDYSDSDKKMLLSGVKFWALEDELVKGVKEEDENVDCILENEEETETCDKSVQVCSVEDCSIEVSSQHLEFFLDSSGHKLVPIELVDSVDEHCSNLCEFGVEEKDGFVDDCLDVDITEEPKLSSVDSIETEVIASGNLQFTVFHESPEFSSEAEGTRDSYEITCFLERIPGIPNPLESEVPWLKREITASEDVITQTMNNENEADISIGTEIPDLDIIDEIPNLEPEHQCSMQVEEQIVDLKPLSVQPSIYSDISTEESLEGELEGGDGVVMIERLKAELRAERKNLQALYSELEEERSASAVAANQTMAMINRLQEEKAAMQMEGLQYQRMMDEQSAYDLAALELLNELMEKKEKEKMELERELEICRKKLVDYETKEESDELSIDLNEEAKGEEGFDYEQEFTPVDTVGSLEESMADFEEERFSILEQVKALEDRLMMTMEDDTYMKVKENGHSNGFLVNGKHNQRRTFLQKGKSLLPLFDAISDENGEEEDETYESKLRTENKKVSIEEEVDNLYQRLQAFEEDREFLKHCLKSINNGDKGMNLLQEILQHLRDLRSMELRARNS